MLVDVRPVREATPSSFVGKVDLSGLRLWGEAFFPQPVDISGTLTLRHGQLEVNYSASYDISARCARCLAEITQREEHTFAHPVKENPTEQESEQLIPAPGGKLDITQLAGADLLLEFTRPPLCSDDCKGLCATCGADLNVGECACASKKEIDPRFAALLDLIEKQDN